jgi:hypothetical protein
VNNLLENWKRECYYYSSPLLIKKELELNRDHIDSVFQIFADYFGLKYFEQSAPEIAIESECNWIQYLLVNPRRPACIAALFEIANIIVYLQTLSKSIQKKFKTLFTDPRQFRDLFFELYIFRLLDYNNIPNQKKAKEGTKELDVVCNINETEFLCECRKLYAPDLNLLQLEKYFTEKLYLHLKTLNKSFGLIGTIKFTNFNVIQVKKNFNLKLIKFIKEFNEQNFSTIDYHDKDENGELSVINYTAANNIETDNNFSQYHIVFKVIPPFEITPGILNHYRVGIEFNFSYSQFKVTRKLLDALTDKQKQHADSKYNHKIYFIDSETIPDFSPPIFRMDSMFEEEEIKKFINSSSENEIFCFIMREYMDDIPKISIRAFGKNIDEKVKQRLERLKTNFDYHIQLK